MRNLLTAILFLSCSPAFAGLIHTYDFSVTATTGVLSGQSSTGQFSYSTPHADIGVLGLPFTDFSWRWDGVDYDETSVLWGFVWIDSLGKIDFTKDGAFGNRCGVGFCSVAGDLFSAADTWNIQYGLSSLSADWAPDGIGFRYHDFGTGPTLNGLGHATFSYLGASAPGSSSVPEPSTALTLGMGLLALWWFRSRRTSISESHT